MYDEIHQALPDVETSEELLMSTLLLGFVAFLPNNGQPHNTAAAIVAPSETTADSNHHTSPLLRKSNHRCPGKAPGRPPTVIRTLLCVPLEKTLQRHWVSANSPGAQSPKQTTAWKAHCSASKVLLNLSHFSFYYLAFLKAYTHNRKILFTNDRCLPSQHVCKIDHALIKLLLHCRDNQWNAVYIIDNT